MDDRFGGGGLADDGGGLASWIALNSFRWTTQSPCIYKVATLKRNPPATSIRYARFVHTDAPHRGGLTWGEVSLIEAVRAWLPQDNFPWEDVIESIYEGRFLDRMPAGVVLRSDAVAAAIPHERPTKLEAACRAATGDRNSGPPCDVRLLEAAGALRGAGY